MVEQQQAVVLLSGGLDSATVLAIARAEGYECVALSFDYGQRHRVELEAARRVAQAQDVSDHLIVAIDLRAFGGSALTDANIAVPEANLEATAIPSTYIPFRNANLLAAATSWAEVVSSGATATTEGAKTGSIKE